MVNTQLKGNRAEEFMLGKVVALMISKVKTSKRVQGKMMWKRRSSPFRLSGQRLPSLSAPLFHCRGGTGSGSEERNGGRRQRAGYLV